MKNHILIIFTLLLISSCSMVGEPYRECPEEDPGETVSLYFEMTASGATTRADDKNHQEEESEIRRLEDGIDFSDLGLFVFVRLLSKPDADEILVLKTTGFPSEEAGNVMVGGFPGAYTVSMEIPRKQLNEILFGKDSDEEINPNGKEQIAFRVLVLANASSMVDADATLWSSVTATTFKGVVDQLNAWHYQMANIYDASYEGDDVGGIYSNDRRNIPMFGTNVFSVTQKALFNSRPEYRVNLGNIDLLRALAKVRVVDNLQDKDGAGYPKIVKADFIGSKSAAHQLPFDAADYKNGNQVHSPNIFDPDKVLDAEDAPEYRLGVMPSALTTVPASQRKGDVFVGFVPEQNIASAGDGLPGFRLTIEFGPSVTRVYDIPMTQYKNTEFNFGENILRNHIYTLSVNNITSTDLEMVVVVAPYLGVSLDPWFGLDDTDTK